MKGGVEGGGGAEMGGGWGVGTAWARGGLGGGETAGLEVSADGGQEAKDRLERYLRETKITVGAAQTDHVLDIEVTVSKGNSRAVVRAVNEHTNLVYIEKDGQVLEERPIEKQEDPDAPDYTLLNVADICEFARTCELSDVSAILDRPSACNPAVAEEGGAATRTGAERPVPSGPSKASSYGRPSPCRRRKATVAPPTGSGAGEV